MSLLLHNIRVAGRRTSIRLEPEMWAALDVICAREKMTHHDFVTAVARKRESGGLTARIRVAILAYFMKAAA